MRNVKNEDLVGKTIESIDNLAVNVLKLNFTDGTNLVLWAEDAVSTPYGNIAGFFVEENIEH